MKTIWLDRVTQLTPEMLAENGIKALILDVDNTLTTHDNPTPADGVLDWLKLMHQHKIGLVILSNNSPQRVERFATLLNLEFVADGAKPFPFGVKKALRVLKSEKKNTAMVGDQVFTDMLAAKTSGLNFIYTKPIELETTFFWKLKRKLEKPFLNTKRPPKT
jgi:HAD superfamily phosphatase (TIGR01668 family)